jgi:rod shape-determining protein MreD
MWVILTTFVIALFLNSLPYPDWMKYAKPDWVMLVLFYWCLAVPNRIGVGYGWLSGFVMDILYYSLLGQHAIGKAFVALVAVSTHRRLRLYDLWQQCIVVFIVASIDIGITVWVYHLTEDTEIQLVFWLSALTSCLIWPVVYNLLRLLRHRSDIS